MKNKMSAILMSSLFAISAVGCVPETENISNEVNTEVIGESNDDDLSNIDSQLNKKIVIDNTNSENINKENTDSNKSNEVLDPTDMFTDRDLEQEADLSEADYITLESNENININEEGVYVLSGEVSDTTITVEVDDEEKVQLVLDGVRISNENDPAIYIKEGDKVFVTTTDSENLLEVTGQFNPDEDNNLDAVIYSKSDLVLNGIGTLYINSNEENGVTSKDDLKITGGTYIITSEKDSLEANDSIRIYDGDITIVANKDGLHSENDDDKSLGYIYIQNGNIEITSADDAIHGNSIVQIDGGSINIIECVEGIEGTYVLINDGTVNIYSTDDAINATSLSDYNVLIEVNGGDITIDMASGDTDGFDSNGDIQINGGNIYVTAVSSFDADGSAVLNDGTVVVNGEVVTELPASQMGGGRNKGH